MHVNTRGRASPTNRAIFWWSNYCARDAKRMSRKASIVKMASRANKRFRVPSFSELEQSADVPDRMIFFQNVPWILYSIIEKTIRRQERQQVQNRPNRSISCERNLYNHNYKKKKSRTVKVCLMNLNVLESILHIVFNKHNRRLQPLKNTTIIPIIRI